MDSKSKLFKTFNLDRGDLWLDVLVPGQEGLSATDTLSFPVTTLAEMQSLGEKNSLLKLKDGREVVLNLSHADLRRKLREAEDTIVDLTAVTNLTPRKQLAAKLKQEFEEAAEREKNKAFNALTFRLSVRTSQKTDFREITFTGADIQRASIASGSSIMGGENVKFNFRAPEKFGLRAAEAIAELELETFNAAVKQALATGMTDIDLRELSMRKGTEIPPEKRKANGPQP
ncbi:MAG: hypothetical protein PSY14_09980 [bacterium]|nr:hypothetical protein [bacterium]